MSLTKQSTVYGILVAGRALISNPENWTQLKCARTKDGERTDAEDPSATCWCTYGAVIRVANMGSPESIKAEELLDQAMEQNFVAFNDKHSHAEVLAAWDRAIASCPTHLK